MADSRTWLIILALQTQLATITVANGYNTDIGHSVWTSDNQRTVDDALGLMIYSEGIAGPGLDRERPGKPVRELSLLVEAQIGAALDDAQAQIHAIIEDLETCLQQYAAAQAAQPGPQVTPMHVADIAILDRPEGLAVVAMQAHIVARYFR